ncbi:tape measure protein, partial [Tistlia consotensis]|uniref:tape measure protein n=1 Tax=Tistlia consotensis TaxID=1321365 RepID=UPI001FD0BD38
FRAVLETIEGSSEKAKVAMDWVSDFAAKTPFQLGEVTSAFVDLRNLGLDPTKGALQAAGDAAAGRRKTFEESVGALSAALRGELQPLEQFGVYAHIEGEKMVLDWDAHGKKMKAVADKNNRAMIASIIQGAWNDKYGGAMEKLSKTWDGIVSNLQDVWSRWTLAVMDNGVFDWMKARLQGLLDRFNAMSADGTLKRWAKDVADRILGVFRATEKLLFGFDEIGDRVTEVVHVPGLFERLGDVLDRVDAFMKPVTDRFGTLETIVGAVGLVIAGPLIGALASLTGAFVTLGVALLTTPLGWFLAAVAAIAGAAYLVYRDWDGIAAWFEALWGRVEQVFVGWTDFLAGVFTGDFGRAWDGLKSVGEGALGFWLTYWDPVIAGFNALVAWIDGTFGTH